MIGYSSSVESSSSSSLSEKLCVLHAEPRGTHKVHYSLASHWDFILETQEAIDTSLVIPHYRARHQPVDHRLNMFVGAQAAPVKLQVCRPMPRCKFYLEVRAEMSNIAVWLPSDFRGHIRYSGQASFSAGFVNRMKANVRLNEETSNQRDCDEVFLHTKGTVTFLMWDVHTGTAEKTHRGTWKRMFGGSKKTEDSEVPRGINWDFLLE